MVEEKGQKWPPHEVLLAGISGFYTGEGGRSYEWSDDQRLCAIEALCEALTQMTIPEDRLTAVVEELKAIKTSEHLIGGDIPSMTDKLDRAIGKLTSPAAEAAPTEPPSSGK